MKTGKKILIGIILTFTIFLISPNKANAALQANGQTSKTLSLDSWILPIRQMQELGGTLGRTDIINTDNFTSDATDLDIHLQKNTEYGAMAILSASSYGNPNKVNPGETTTGNPTGVVINGAEEYTASGIASIVEDNLLYYKKLSPRYKDVYNGSTWKNGDAIDIYTWHGGTRGGYAGYNTFIRYQGSIFGLASGIQSSNYIFKFNRATRAAIVVGSDL